MYIQSYSSNVLMLSVPLSSPFQEFSHYLKVSSILTVQTMKTASPLVEVSCVHLTSPNPAVSSCIALPFSRRAPTFQSDLGCHGKVLPVPLPRQFGWREITGSLIDKESELDVLWMQAIRLLLFGQ